MAQAPVAHRRHAIFKHHYRRVVAATPGFHELDLSAQWQLLRNQVQIDPAPHPPELLSIMDRREPRRQEVIAALEQARQEGWK
jgi:hypothetical protein